MSSTLLMIPDISGFTEFVNRTEIEHSQHIISELLEIIIHEQNLKMEIAEIEGDAILFYKENFDSGIDVILEQAEAMLVKFHNHLKLYEHSRICNCGACSTATHLSLKFVIHKSEIGFTTVNRVKKPFGPGLVLIHRILKNSIDSNEYLLFTEELFPDIDRYRINHREEPVFVEGADTYPAIGAIRYRYVNLTPVLKKVDPVIPSIFSSRTAGISFFEGIIDRPMQEVYDIVINLQFRTSWIIGLQDIIHEKNRINRVGTKHVCIYSGNKIEFETIPGSIERDSMIYGEKIDNLFFNRHIKFYYIMEKRGDKTQMRMEMHFTPKGFIGSLLLPFLKIQARKDIRKNFLGLKELCESKVSSEVS